MAEEWARAHFPADRRPGSTSKMPSPSMPSTSYANNDNSSPFWLTVEYIGRNKKKCYKIIHRNELVENVALEKLYTGKLIQVIDENGVVGSARIAMVSESMSILEGQISHLRKAAENPKYLETASTTDEDFAASGSDWEPENRRTSYKDDSKNRLNFKKYVQNTVRKSKVRTYVYKDHKRVSKDLASRQDVHVEINSTQQSNTSGVNDYKDINEAMQRLRHDFKEISIQSVVEGPSTSTGKKPMCNKETQTDTDVDIKNLAYNQSLFIKQIQFWGSTISDLRKQVDILKGIIERNNTRPHALESSTDSVDVTMGVSNVLRESNQNNLARQITPPYVSPSSADSFENERKPSSLSKRNSFGMIHSTPKRQKSSANVDNGMVTIGTGKTIIPKHIYDQIKWNSYTSATRKLLMAVFPRRTLATHSLTGKSSPAFSDRPAKNQLDTKKIQDIVITVSEMCQVPSSLVRNTITVKCSDENKMYRTRLGRIGEKMDKKTSANRENQKPGPSRQ